VTLIVALTLSAYNAIPPTLVVLAVHFLVNPRVRASTCVVVLTLSTYNVILPGVIL
jgi:hypothetical protein